MCSWSTTPVNLIQLYNKNKNVKFAYNVSRTVQNNDQQVNDGQMNFKPVKAGSCGILLKL